MSDIIKELIEFKEWCKENNLNPNDDNSLRAYMNKDKVSVDETAKSFIEKSKTDKVDGVIIIGFIRDDKDDIEICTSINGMLNNRAVLSAFSNICDTLVHDEDKDEEEQ